LARFDVETEVVSVAAIFGRAFIRGFKYGIAFVLREKKKKIIALRSREGEQIIVSFSNTILYNANVQLRLIGSCAAYRDR